MKENSPLPPIYPLWHHHHHPSVNGWDIPLQSRIDQWHMLANVQPRRQRVHRNRIDTLIIND